MEAHVTRRFPLNEAYTFADSHGLTDAAMEIRAMEIEWDRPYTSSVRRGYFIRLFEKHGLLPQFIDESWPFGGTPKGDAERRHCLRIADEYDEFPNGNGPGDEKPRIEILEFALEAHLRDFLAKNLEQVEQGLCLYREGERTGVEFQVDGGRIDILATDASGKFVVFELKLSRGRQKALGQLLYYMGWVDQNLGNGPCRGIIVASDISEELTVAVSRVSGVMLARYKMSFAIEPVVPNGSEIE